MVSTATQIYTRGSTPKAYRAGTHRLVEPKETLARVHPLLPAMGITRIANITGLDRIGVHVVQALRPNSRTLAVSQGKGLDLAAAKASAVMEAVEAYHSDHITLPVKHARYTDLIRNHRIVDVAALSRPKTSDYHPELPLLWIEGWDLLQNESVWLPFEMVDGNFTFPRPAGSGCFAATSNGLASGNHLLEAISHGISEVVERDATTLWGLAGKEAQDLTRIDLQTVQDAACQDVLDKFARAGIVVGVWETTSDIGIPAFLCKIRERNDRMPGNMETPGYGCHPSRPIALLRALTEAAQTRLTIIAGSRDDLVRSGYEQLGNPLVSWPKGPAFDNKALPRNFSKGSSYDSGTFEQDVSWLLERLRATGMQRVIVVDLTKPELGLPVVRVVIPGLEMAIINPEYYALGQRAQMLLQNRS
jgi:YcaO-like protein with predicted kinase domain